jgi:hypothetical protein
MKNSDFNATECITWHSDGNPIKTLKYHKILADKCKRAKRKRHEHYFLTNKTTEHPEK